jgi:hypothetical protein
MVSIPNVLWDVYERHGELRKWKKDFEALHLGSGDISSLYRVFSKIDGDGSGEIDVLELLM